ncbi:MAG TPA: hypothetical protein PKA64_02345 [Myxococcota bacterium]|nr:hypothetical protein [Myxococcota bacterium]
MERSRVGMWVAWALAGCTSDPSTDGTDSPVAPDPQVTIVTPTVDAEVSGATLRVEVTVADFELTPRDEVAWAPGWGLLGWTAAAAAHTVGEAPNGYVGYAIDGTELAATTELAVTLPLDGVPPGTHDLVAQLYYPDGDGFYPPVLDQVTFHLVAP